MKKTAVKVTSEKPVLAKPIKTDSTAKPVVHETEAVIVPVEVVPVAVVPVDGEGTRKRATRSSKD